MNPFEKIGLVLFILGCFAIQDANEHIVLIILFTAITLIGLALFLFGEFLIDKPEE